MFCHWGLFFVDSWIASSPGDMDELTADRQAEYDAQLDALVEKLSAFPEHDAAAQEIGGAPQTKPF